VRAGWLLDGSGLLALACQRHGGVFNHVFLPAHHAASSHLDQNVAGADAILLLGAFGKQQETAVDPGVT
jgi:hypothetical protein